MRPRVCAAIFRGDNILMVHHVERDRSYWTLPGGAVETGESPTDAVLREVAEETGLRGRVERLLFEGRYGGGPEHCFLVAVPGEAEPALGHDPEEEEAEHPMLAGVAWRPLEEVRDDHQVARALAALEPS